MKLSELKAALEKIEPESVEKLVDLIDKADSIIIIGNGGSNAIASHISQDYTKKLGKRSFSFSDPSRLTCYINDYGIERAYSQFLREFSDKDTLVILISSSGNSPNILECAKFCTQSNTKFVIFTGFSRENPLRTQYSSQSQLEFWVESCDYGVVECAHQAVLHVPA